MTVGAFNGAEPLPLLCMPNMLAARTEPACTANGPHRRGMSEVISRIEAARSAVRAEQAGSAAHSWAYREICLSVIAGSHTMWPGGLTPIIAERNSEVGCRQA